MQPIPGPFFHGTAAALARGDLIVPGHPANYGAGRPATWVYVSARLDIAVLAAEVAAPTGRARVYVVEPTGAIEDDPNVTDRKFPGNPTRSFRTQAALRVVGEVIDWAPTPADRLADLRAFAARTRAEGIEPIA
jgi:rifampin ADP-ribosylating transferase